ncbi:MAG: hypothetical protein F4128_13680 [Gammaproteobacteria bacterium]|nr:hypothetical protein [Gammaproteobacteria bacterium]
MSRKSLANLLALEAALLAVGAIMETTFGIPIEAWWVILAVSALIFWLTLPRSPVNSQHSRDEETMQRDESEITDRSAESGGWSEESRLTLELQRRRLVFWKRQLAGLSVSEFLAMICFILVLFAAGYLLT